MPPLPPSIQVPTAPREQPVNRAPARLARLLLHPAVLFTVILALLAVRSWSALRSPVMALEDGSILLSKYFNSPGFSSVFDFYAGYLSLVSNLIAWAATRGPVTAAPYIFTGSAVLFASAGIFLLTRPSYAWLLADPVDRAYLALALCCLPLGRGLLLANLCYSQWSLLFLLVVMLARPLPDRGPRLAAYLLAIMLCVFSHPLSVNVLPMCAVQWVVERRRLQRWGVAAVMGAVLLYLMIGVDHRVPVQVSFHSCVLAAKLWGSRVCFEAVFGAKATVLLLAKVPRYVHLLGLGIFGLLASAYCVPAASSRQRMAAALGVGLAAGLLLINTGTRLILLPADELLNPHLQRYFYVSKLLVVVLLLSQLIPRLRLGLGGWRWPARTIFLLAGMSYLLALNQAAAFLYASSRADGLRLAVFLQDVEANVAKARAGQPYRSEWNLPRAESWDIPLSIDAHLQKRP